MTLNGPWMLAMTELMAPSTSLSPATRGGRDIDLKGVAARLARVEDAKVLLRAAAVPRSLDVVAEMDRAAAAVGIFLVLVFGICVLALG